jgi:hypothetical protein
MGQREAPLNTRKLEFAAFLATSDFLGRGKHDLALHCCYFHSTFFLQTVGS